MPVTSVPRTEPASSVQARIEELEAAGGSNFRVTSVGEAWLITYDAKPKVGRPPKMETRG